jgi:F-type H+-transporting ATPase subunit epsilon
MDTFGLKIIASDGVFYEGRCKKLIIPAPDGEKGILANHENMVIAVNVGVAHMSLDGDEVPARGQRRVDSCCCWNGIC